MKTNDNPTHDENKIMQRLCNRFKYKNDDLDVAKAMVVEREKWIEIDKNTHDALNTLRVPHKIRYKNPDTGEIEEIDHEIGMGNAILGEEVADMIHFHNADDDFEDQIMKETSITNNGGTNVDEKVLKECLGVDNKSQFLGGFERGETTVQKDADGNVTGLIIQQYAIVLQVNENPPPAMTKKRVVVAEKRFRPTGGSMHSFASTGKWSGDGKAKGMQDCFESKRAK